MVDIILVEPEHEGNVGAVCRAMANFNCKNLIIINPKCDLESDELFKRAKHSKDIVKSIKVRKTIPKTYDLLVGTTGKVSDDFNIRRASLTPKQLANKELPKKTAIMFGREGNGLSNEELDRCDFALTIPTADSYPVMNLSHAVAVCLYELSSSQKKRTSITPANKDELKHLHQTITQLIKKVKFTSSQKEQTQKKLWKSIFGKAILTKREVNGIMGLLRKLK